MILFRAFRVLLCGLLLFAPLSCQKEQPVDTSGVDPLAREILSAIAQGNAETVYEAYFTPEYKQELSPEEWKQITTGYRDLFGKVVSVTRARGGAHWVDGEFIDGQVVYTVQWDKGNGELTLDVTEDNGWKVRQLRIQSPQIEERVARLTAPSAQPAPPENAK